MSEHSFDVHRDEEKPPVTVNYTAMKVHTTCRCGNKITVARLGAGAVTSGIFCGSCHRHCWVDWSKGVLHIDETKGNTL